MCNAFAETQRPKPPPSGIELCCVERAAIEASCEAMGEGLTRFGGWEAERFCSRLNCGSSGVPLTD